jgi:hypothetical protein
MRWKVDFLTSSIIELPPATQNSLRTLNSTDDYFRNTNFLWN